MYTEFIFWSLSSFILSIDKEILILNRGEITSHLVCKSSLKWEFINKLDLTNQSTKAILAVSPSLRIKLHSEGVFSSMDSRTKQPFSAHKDTKVLFLIQHLKKYGTSPLRRPSVQTHFTISNNRDKRCKVLLYKDRESFSIFTCFLLEHLYKDGGLQFYSYFPIFTPNTKHRRPLGKSQNVYVDVFYTFGEIQLVPLCCCS